MNFSVKKGDYVKIIAGNDKGKFGQIVAVDKKAGRVTVEGKDLSVVKKAVKARKASDKAGIIELPKSTDISNVMPVCAACGKATRVRHGEVDGKKVRVCAKCGAVLETKKAKEEKKSKAKATTRKKKTAETAVAEAEVKATEETKAAESADNMAEKAEVKEEKAVKATTRKKKVAESAEESKVEETPVKAKAAPRKKKAAESAEEASGATEAK